MDQIKMDMLIGSLEQIREVENISFYKFIRIGLKTLKPSKRRFFILFFVSIILIYPLSKIYESNNTISIIEKIISNSNSLILGIFAVIFTGYVLFQALVNRESLISLFLGKINGKNNFLIYNFYFISLCLLYLSILGFNYILSVMMLSIDGLHLLKIIEIRVISFIFLDFYVIFILFALTEIKSFLMNLFHCFNLSASSIVVNALKEEAQKEEVENKVMK